MKYARKKRSFRLYNVMEAKGQKDIFLNISSELQKQKEEKREIALRHYAKMRQEQKMDVKEILHHEYLLYLIEIFKGIASFFTSLFGN